MVEQQWRTPVGPVVPLTQNGFVLDCVAEGVCPPFGAAPLVPPPLLSQQIAKKPTTSSGPTTSPSPTPALFDHAFILGPNQITDVDLLGLAVKHGGRLVTFDRRLPLKAVRGAEARHLVVL